MPTYSPTAAAAMVGVSLSTLRNWCKEFAGNLSEGASPPAGTERKLTAQDIAILQRVKDLRSVGMATGEIKDTLQTEGTTTLQPYVDVAPVTPALQPVESPESPQSNDTALQVVALVNEQMTAIQARIDAMQKQQTTTISAFMMGVIVGLLLALVAGVFFLLGARLGG